MGRSRLPVHAADRLLLSPPLPPPPRRWAARAFERYLRGQFQSHFTAVHWGPVQRIPPRPPLQPILFVANHTNWWDGFLAYMLTARMGLHVHVLMEAVHLERYWMFKLVGTLPLRREAAAGAYADLAGAARHLRRPATGMWIFPQGVRTPPDAPIRATGRGAAHLALSLAQPLTIWPVAFRYRYLGEQLPEAFAWLGEPWEIGTAAGDDGPDRRAARRGLAERIERQLQQAVDTLDARLANEALEEFAVLIPGRLSINKRLDRVRHALGLLRGPFEQRNG